MIITKFQRLYLCFRIPVIQWDYLKYCTTQPVLENRKWRPSNRKDKPVDKVGTTFQRLYQCSYCSHCMQSLKHFEICVRFSCTACHWSHWSHRQCDLMQTLILLLPSLARWPSTKAPSDLPCCSFRHRTSSERTCRLIETLIPKQGAPNFSIGRWFLVSVDAIQSARPVLLCSTFFVVPRRIAMSENLDVSERFMCVNKRHHRRVVTCKQTLGIAWHHSVSLGGLQAARQGVAVLMASAVVVIKHETSTTYQCHIYESIDLQFG